MSSCGGTGAKYHRTMRLKVGVLRVCDCHICSVYVGINVLFFFIFFILPAECKAVHQIFRVGLAEILFQR